MCLNYFVEAEEPGAARLPTGHVLGDDAELFGPALVLVRITGEDADDAESLGIDPDRLAERTPTLCFNLDGWTARELSAALGERGIFTYDGNYYALNAMTALGLEESGGAVRAGYLHYTTHEEAERFCAVLAELA